jgi:hypothetical protein
MSSLYYFCKNNFNNKNYKLTLKKQRFVQFIKSINLNLYYKKNIKNKKFKFKVLKTFSKLIKKNS